MFEAGDVVFWYDIHGRHIGLVTHVEPSYDGESNLVMVMQSNGDMYPWGDDDVDKTGMTIPKIADILQELKTMEDNNGCSV